MTILIKIGKSKISEATTAITDWKIKEINEIAKNKYNITSKESLTNFLS